MKAPRSAEKTNGARLSPVFLGLENALHLQGQRFPIGNRNCRAKNCPNSGKFPSCTRPPKLERFSPKLLCVRGNPGVGRPSLKSLSISPFWDKMSGKTEFLGPGCVGVWYGEKMPQKNPPKKKIWLDVLWVKWYCFSKDI